VALLSAGTGVLRLGPGAPKSFARKAALGAAVLAAGSIAQMLFASRTREAQLAAQGFQPIEPEPES
jgi:hypothetical protein